MDLYVNIKNENSIETKVISFEPDDERTFVGVAKELVLWLEKRDEYERASPERIAIEFEVL